MLMFVDMVVGGVYKPPKIDYVIYECSIILLYYFKINYELD